MCEYCKNGKRIESKKNFPYFTRIEGDTLYIAKMRRFTRMFFPRGLFRKFPVGIYCLSIKYCPMCGKKLNSGVEE